MPYNDSQQYPTSAPPSPAPTTKPRTKRRNRITAVDGTPPASTYNPVRPPPVTVTRPTPPAPPPPAWGPSYYKPRPGLVRTLTELRASIGDDRQTSYILGDMLEARYGKMDDIRYNQMQKQADDFQHDIEIANISQQNDQPYTLPDPSVDSMPKGTGPGALIQELMQKLKSGPGTDGYRDAVTQTYKTRIEDAQDIQDDIRGQRGRLGNYLRDFNNTVEERDLRDGASDDKAAQRGEDVNEEAPWYLPPAAWNEGQKEAYAAHRTKGAIDYGINNVLGGLFDPQPPEQSNEPEEGWLNRTVHSAAKGLTHVLPGYDESDVKEDGAVNDFLKTVSDEAEDPLWWTLDKLSRPLYGVNTGYDKFLSLDKDRSPDEHSSTIKNFLFGGIVGQGPGESLNELTPGKLAGVAGSAVKGFYSGGLGNSKDPAFFGDTIRHQAELNPEKNVYDDERYQLWAGLAGDLIADPLNYVGTGLVKTPATLATRGIMAPLRDATLTARAERTATKISKYLDETEHSDDFIGPEWKPSKEEINKIILGRSVNRPRTEGERIEFMNEGQHAIERMDALLSTRRPVGTSTRDIETIQRGLEVQRQQVVKLAGGQSYLNELQREMQTKILRGEETIDVNNVVDTAKVYNIIDDALRHEDWLDTMAKEHFGARTQEGFRSRALETWDEVEAEYENTVARAQAGHIGREEVEKFRAQIDYAISPKIHPDGSIQALPDSSIDDLLGKGWQADPTLTAAETRKALRQARQLIKSDTEARKVQSSIYSTNTNLKNTKKTLEKQTAAGQDTTRVKSYLAQHRRKLTHYNDIRRMQTSDLFVRLLKSHMAAKSGEKVYGNADEVAALDTALAEVESRLAKEVEGGNKNISSVSEGKSDDVERNVDYIYRGEDGKMSADIGALENDPVNFESYHQQLEFMRDRILEQKSRLEFNPSDKQGSEYDADAIRAHNVAEPEHIKLPPTPQMLLNEDGTLNRQFLHQVFKIDDYGNVVIKHSGQLEIDDWLNKLETIAKTEYDSNFMRIRDNLARRSREAYQGVRENEVIEQVNPMVRKMFGPTGFFKIDVAGEPLEIGEALKRIKPTNGDHQSSTAMIGIMEKLRMGGEVSHQQIGRLRDALRAAGVGIPDSAKDARAFLTHNEDDIFMQGVRGESKVEGLMHYFNAEEVAFRREFKAQHNMTLRDALIERDIALGKTVTMRGGPWAKRFPRGITKREYMLLAQNTRDDFRDLTVKGSFGGLLRRGGKSEKQARIANNNVVDEEWVTRTWQSIKDMNPAQRNKYLDRMFERAIRQQKVKPKVEPIEAAERLEAKVQLTKEQYKAIRAQAKTAAFDVIERQANKSGLELPVGRTELGINPLSDVSSPQEMYAAMKYQLGHEQADLLYARTLAEREGQHAKVTELNGQIKDLEAKKVQLRAEHEARTKVAQATEAELKIRIKEDSILRAAELSLATTKKQFSLNVMGTQIGIPTTEKLFQAAEKISGVPVIKEMRQLYANSFKSPAKSLNHDELRYARGQALAQAPVIIEHHIRTLQHTLGKFDMSDRVEGLKDLMRGSPQDNEVTQGIRDAFSDDLVADMSGRTLIGDEHLTLHDINKYLPQELSMSNKEMRQNISFKTPDDIIRKLSGYTNKKGKFKLRVEDPYELSWKLRVAVEQAKAYKAVQYTVKSGLGTRKVAVTDPAYEAISKLPGLGWKELEVLGNKHYFPPQVVGDIENLFKMLEPRSLSDFGKLADKATGYWKTSTTVYNPGFWTRNGVGEAMSSWFAGVNSHVPYQKSMKVIAYWRKDGKELDALSQQFPWMRHEMDRPTKDTDVITSTGAGHKLTASDLVVLFNDHALKTGYFNTEFQAGFTGAESGIRGAANKATNFFTPKGKTVSNPLGTIHQGLRSAGEWYEDYFRMAHFIHAIGKHNGTPAQAAKAAADEVKKYHFDYSDFSNFEKTVMLRAFPFYKWTRKALPLMLTMLFTKPGKVMAYPKVMNAIGNSVSTGDIAQDENGFAPNYEGIVPSWIQDLWAYQIPSPGDDGEEDGFGQQNETYFNLATPQFDTYKALTNPGNAAYGLLNPYLKVPDQILAGTTGHGIGELVGTDSPYVDNDPSGYLSAFAKNAPQSNMLQKFANKKTSGEDWASFLTGLGFYGSDTDRRMGEMIQDKR